MAGGQEGVWGVIRRCALSIGMAFPLRGISVLGSRGVLGHSWREEGVNSGVA